MSPRTVFLSKLLGLYCLVMVLALLLNKAAILQAIPALAQNWPLMLVTGVFTLFAGLAMVLGHNVWRGGGVTVVVTLVGWLTLFKALLILFLPPAVESRILLTAAQSGSVSYIRLALTFLLGVYLTYCGFAASRSSQHS